MHQRTSSVRPFALTMALALVTSALVLGGGSVADADTFTPSGTEAPRVVITAWDPTFQPAYPVSDEVYEVVVEARDEDGVTTIAAVELCIFSYTGGADEACAYDDADPRSTFQLVWTPDGLDQESFAIDSSGVEGFAKQQPGNLYAFGEDERAQEGGVDHRPTWATSGGGSPGVLTVSFRFRVSIAMLVGDEWTIRATVRDQDEEWASDDVGFFEFCADPSAPTTPEDDCSSTGTVTVNYFGSVEVDRASIDFGSVAEGEESVVEDRSLGEFAANDVSFTSLTATDFVHVPGGSGSPSTLVLIDTTPESGEVSLRCNPGAEFAPVGGVTPTYLRGTPVLFEARVFESILYGPFGPDGEFTLEDRGTGEQPRELLHSCALRYGGGATAPSQVHSADVTVAIGQVGTFG